jgi:hypothetical protein
MSMIVYRFDPIDLGQESWVSGRLGDDGRRNKEHEQQAYEFSHGGAWYQSRPDQKRTFGVR